ncbi:SUKH-4 family immunity protein [Streptomyces sp. NBC_00457]|uniref:SUKH-4 family immunity protein n=1 Tax=Streptomyces sp. NBC_00457 TaxID=2975748 RepID=UPI002E1C5B90
MVTFAQAQERAEEWINGDVPAYQHREVRVREFELGFVVWAEDRADGPSSDGGRQRLVIARDSGEATLWPSLPVGEVIRRYEEEYGGPDGTAEPAPAPAAPARVDLNQTSFLLTPPEWLQEAADQLGIADRRGASAGASGSSSGAGAGSSTAGSSSSAGAGASGAGSGTGASAGARADQESAASAAAAAAGGASDGAGGGGRASETGGGAGVRAGAPSGPSGAGVPAGATPWAGTDTNADAGDDRSVPLPETVFAPPLSGADDETSPPTPPDAKTALMSGGSQLPPTAQEPAIDDTGAPGAPRGSMPPPAPSYGYPQGPGGPQGSIPPPAPSYGYPQGPGAPGGPGAPSYGYPQGPGGADAGTPSPGAPGRPLAPNAEDIADAATSKAGPPRAARGGAVPPPPPPGAPGAPGARAGGPPPPPPPPPSGPGAPGTPAGGYVPTQLVSALGPDGSEGPGGAGGGPQTPGAPNPPGAPGAPGGTPPGGVHHAATVLSDPGRMGPGAPGAPQPPGAPGMPGSSGGQGAVHHAETVLSAPPAGAPGPPPPPPQVPGPPPAPGAPGVPGAPGTAPGAGQTPPGAAPPGQAPPGHVPPGAMPPGPVPPPTLPGPGHPMPGHTPPGQIAPGQTAPGPPPPSHPTPGHPMSGQPTPGQPTPGHPTPGHPTPGHPTPAQSPPPAQHPPAYGYPQPPTAQPTVGPGYQAVLRYRAQDGSEQQLIRRSAPGTPHPEWQIFHELRAMNIPPDKVLELHTELESCELPGAYCARMIREQWPQARITSIAPYGTDHASRQQGMQQLLAHQGELHQVADGPARPAPVRAPLPQVQSAPPIPPEGIAQELAGAFGPGIFRFEEAAVSRQGVPPVVAHSLVMAGLPTDMGPFFWAQAQPGRPVPTLAELAAERGVQPAPDAGSYLVMGSDFGKAICVQYGTANIVAVPVEAGPGGTSVPPQFVNTGLPEFQRCLALLGRMWRLRFGLNQEQAGRWTVDFQAQLASLDPAALGSPESWWSVLLEEMWDGLL